MPLDPNWGGSVPLTDAFLYDEALTGAWELRRAVGDGTYHLATPYTLPSGFKVVSGHFTDDEMEDLFMWKPSNGDYRFLKAGGMGFTNLTIGNASPLISADVYVGTWNRFGRVQHRPDGHLLSAVVAGCHRSFQRGHAQ